MICGRRIIILILVDFNMNGMSFLFGLLKRGLIRSIFILFVVIVIGSIIWFILVVWKSFFVEFLLMLMFGWEGIWEILNWLIWRVWFDNFICSVWCLEVFFCCILCWRNWVVLICIFVILMRMVNFFMSWLS